MDNKSWFYVGGFCLTQCVGGFAMRDIIARHFELHSNVAAITLLDCSMVLLVATLIVSYIKREVV